MYNLKKYLLKVTDKNINLNLLNKLNFFDNILNDVDYYYEINYNEISNIYKNILNNFINIFEDEIIYNTYSNKYDINNKEIIKKKINEINEKINYKKFINNFKLYYFDLIENSYYKIDDLDSILFLSNYFKLSKIFNLINYFIIFNNCSNFENYISSYLVYESYKNTNLKIILDYLFNLNLLNFNFLNKIKFYKIDELPHHYLKNKINFNNDIFINNIILYFLISNNETYFNFILNNLDKNYILKYLLIILSQKQLLIKENYILKIMLLFKNDIPTYDKKKKLSLIIKIFYRLLYHSLPITIKNIYKNIYCNYDTECIIINLIKNNEISKICNLLDHNIINIFFKEECIWDNILIKSNKFTEVIKKYNLIIPFKYFDNKFNNFDNKLFTKKNINNFIFNLEKLDIPLNDKMICNLIKYLSDEIILDHINNKNIDIHSLIPFIIDNSKYKLLDKIFNKNLSYNIIDYINNFNKYILKFYDDSNRIKNSKKIIKIYNYNIKNYNIKPSSYIKFIGLYANNISFLKILTNKYKINISTSDIYKYFNKIKNNEYNLYKFHFNNNYKSLFIFLKDKIKDYNNLFLNDIILEEIIYSNINISLNDLIELKNINPGIVINLREFNYLFKNYKDFIVYYFEDKINKKSFIDNLFYYINDENSFQNFLLLINNFNKNEIIELFYKYKKIFNTKTIISKIYEYIFNIRPSLNILMIICKLNLIKFNSYFLTFIVSVYYCYDYNYGIIKYLINKNISIKIKTYNFLVDVKNYLKYRLNNSKSICKIELEKKYKYFNNLIESIHTKNIIYKNDINKKNKIIYIEQLKDAIDGIVFFHINKNLNNNLIEEL